MEVEVSEIEREIREALRRLREEGTISTPELEEALAGALTSLVNRQLTSYNRGGMHPSKLRQPRKHR